MKALLCFVFFLLVVPSLLRAEELKGYQRTDETHVAPQQGNNIDGTPYNPYGLPMNYNPSDGKNLSGNLENYLNQYKQTRPRSEQDYSPLNPFVIPW